jgi:molybdopterin-guanine dinucleotide biosynthesis protein A
MLYYTAPGARRAGPCSGLCSAGGGAWGDPTSYHAYMDARDEWAGFVLVGGASSRMGRDKACLPFLGKTLVEHVGACVEEAAGSVTLVGAPERYKSLRFPLLADTHAGFGPLGAIHTALGASPAEWNLIVACDMPEVSADFLRRLRAAAEHGGGDCLIPAGPSGRLEPLCAAYRTACFGAIGAALDRGVRKVTDGLAGLRVETWDVAASHWFSNVNTPEEWIRRTHG